MTKGVKTTSCNERFGVMAAEARHYYEQKQ